MVRSRTDPATATGSASTDAGARGHRGPSAPTRAQAQELPPPARRRPLTRTIAGGKSLRTARRYRRFVRITQAGLRESHAHDVAIAKRPESTAAPEAAGSAMTRRGHSAILPLRLRGYHEHSSYWRAVAYEWAREKNFSITSCGDLSLVDFGGANAGHAPAASSTPSTSCPRVIPYFLTGRLLRAPARSSIRRPLLGEPRARGQGSRLEGPRPRLGSGAHRAPKRSTARGTRRCAVPMDRYAASASPTL